MYGKREEETGQPVLVNNRGKRNINNKINKLTFNSTDFIFYGKN